jgi:UPF0716 protein FxsA
MRRCASHRADAFSVMIDTPGTDHIRLIPILLLALPLLEIATFVVVGSAIGVLPTLGLVLASFVLGAVLLRTGGLGARARAQAELQAGRDPGQHVVGAVMTVVAAVLLLIPGFLTDVVALLLLVPGVRGFVWRRLKSRIAVSGNFTTFRGGFGQTRWSGDRTQARGPVVDLDEADYSRGPNPDSPWRIGKE